MEIPNFINPDTENQLEYIISAAIYFDDEKIHAHQPKNIKTGFVITGRRHHNIYATLFAITNDISSHTKYKHIQGFITSKDLFVSRKEAAIIALSVGQIKLPTLALFSEDLY